LDVIAGRQLYTYGRFCRQREVVTSAPRGETVVLSGRRRTSRPSLVTVAVRVRCTSRDILALSVNAVKQTDRLYHPRCREFCRRHRFCSALRRWYLHSLLVGFPLFP